MRNSVRKIIFYTGNLLRYIKTNFYRISGAKIGKNTMISLGAKVDTRRGSVIIGDNCLITHGVYILSHDGAAHVLDSSDDGSGFVEIGNNVFIGVNSVILRNVKIGNNAIIGAGSVVIDDVPEGTLYAGNPARFIKDVPKPYRDLPKKHKV